MDSHLSLRPQGALHGCKQSRMTYQLELKRGWNGVRLWTQMQIEQDDVSTEGGEGTWWCQIVDPDAKRAGRHTSWRWRESLMVSDYGPRCEESRTTYQLEVEREQNGVRLWTGMQREQDDVLSKGGERVGWCQIVDPDANRAGQCTNWRWRESVMVSDCEPGCKESRKTYFLEVERERDGVRLWTQMQREQDNVPTGGREGAWWC